MRLILQDSCGVVHVTFKFLSQIPVDHHERFLLVLFCAAIRRDSGPL